MIVNRRIFSSLFTTTRSYQVTVVGATSEVGQVLSLLLRSLPLITKLVVHDNKEFTPGVALDLSQIPSPSRILGLTGEDTLERALKNSDLVIAAGGLSQRPDISEKALLTANSQFIKSVVSKLGRSCPVPFVGIITEPINYLIPMTAEIMRNHGVYDEKKLFGITEIDAIRSQCLYATENNLKANDCYVPVIGGHSDKTIVPLLSQAKPTVEMKEKDLEEFTIKLRNCDGMITKAKRGCIPNLSVAYSSFLFTKSILDALEGSPANIHAFVDNNDFGTSYFSGLVNLDKNGVKEMVRYSEFSKFECDLIEKSLQQLRKDVSKGRKILELA